MLEVSNGNRGPVTESAIATEAGSDPVSVVDEDAAVDSTPSAESTSPRAEITTGAALRTLVRAPGRWLITRGRSLVVLVVIAGLLGALIATDLRLRHDEALGSARTSALSAADTYAVDLASYDYRHLDQDFGTVRQHSSPAFQATFQQSSNALASVLAKYQATATASVLSAGVVSSSTGRAVVLVFLQQTVTNSTQKGGPQKDQSRVQMTLIRDHGRWLIDQVKLL